MGSLSTGAPIFILLALCAAFLLSHLVNEGVRSPHPVRIQPLLIIPGNGGSTRAHESNHFPCSKHSFVTTMAPLHAQPPPRRTLHTT